MSINQNKDILYTKLAFQQAEINLGSTNTNPSVGCVVVKNSSVISSGFTSVGGRPHAEFNALKKKLNYTNSDLYVSLEPCTHYGKTPPCTNKIIKKKIKKVTFPINDIDYRTKKKSTKILKKKNIIVKKYLLNNFAKNFYQSYFLCMSKKIPFIDAKIAISKNFYTKNVNKKFITNSNSRNLGNFLRSRYDSLLTTSKTINEDNPFLNCRIEGLESKTPTLFILDRYFRIKKNINLFKIKRRQIYIFTTVNNRSKENFFKKKGFKIVKFTETISEEKDLKTILFKIKKLGFNRIFFESGITLLNKFLKYKLIKNLYLFKSSKNIVSYGCNSSSFFNIKKVKRFSKNQVKVNLKGDSLHKIKL